MFRTELGCSRNNEIVTDQRNLSLIKPSALLCPKLKTTGSVLKTERLSEAVSRHENVQYGLRELNLENMFI